MSNTWTTTSILDGFTSPNFWGTQTFLLFIIKEKLLLSIWISQVSCVYYNFTSSKAEDIPSADTQSPCQTIWTQMFICIAAGKSACINGWKCLKNSGNVFFPLMKNHTKYFSSHIRIFNFKKKCFSIWWPLHWLESAAHEKKKMGLQDHFPSLCLVESTV